MSVKDKIYAHFILEQSDKILLKRLLVEVPNVGDTIRTGGEGAEKYHEVTLVIWVYDEPDSPFERVNIGVKPAKAVVK